ncbi:MAG: ATP-binding cassette domain-containing protein [Treponemataceae bacterium]
MLAVHNLSFSYPKAKQPLFENLSFTVQENQIVGIIAPSGYGKTTLCKIIAGYQTAQHGFISLDGKVQSKHNALSYNPIQMIWQHPELAVNPYLPIKYTLKESPCSPEILDKLGIQTTWFNRLPKELSAGEIQRFCIARILNNKTRFILADEITTMFDTISQSQIWHVLINHIKTHHIGMIAVSHSPTLLEKIADHIIQPPLLTNAY